MYNSNQLLDIAIDIIKEYSHGGGEHPGAHLKNVFEALKELNKETEQR